MTRDAEGRLTRLERTIQQSPGKRFEAMDLDGLRRQVCAEFGISDAELDRQLTDPTEAERDSPPAASAYWVGFGRAMRRCGLTFSDLIDLADREVTTQ